MFDKVLSLFRRRVVDPITVPQRRRPERREARCEVLRRGYPNEYVRILQLATFDRRIGALDKPCYDWEKTPGNVLAGLFNFDETPEGFDYWRALADRYIAQRGDLGLGPLARDAEGHFFYPVGHAC